MPSSPTRSTSPLSIVVVGVGKIGSAFAYQLAKAGHHVTGVARPDSSRLRQLRHDHAICLQDGDRAELPVTDRLEPGVRYDLAIVTTPGHQVGSLLPALKRSRAECVHFMFVTFEAERIRSEMGDHPCTFGMPAINASLDGDGRLTTKIGRQKTLHGDQRWVDLFNEAGIPSALEQNMPLWLRCHAPMTAALESVAVARRSSEDGGFRQKSRTAAIGMRAGFTIIEALGDRPYPRSKAIMNRAPQPLLAFILRVSARFFPDDLTQAAIESQELIDVITTAATDRPHLARPTQAVLAMRP